MDKDVVVDMFSKDSGFVFVDGHDLRQKDKKSQD
jgi:hypothetical protein